jgi:CheY-like chemotaxis protein/anti-sigma regulatory factor (Ser/Thr protein kinase)
MHAATDAISAKVLAVDDEPFDLLLIDRYLSRAGFEVTRANSGAHAMRILEKAGDDLPEAILLDRLMPEMNGIEFMELLAADARLRDIPVIMQTGLADPDQIAYGIAKGARYYVAKPFTGELLVSMVRAAVREGRNLRNLRSSSAEFAHSLTLLRAASYELRTLEEAGVLAAQLSQIFPDPQRVVFGLVEMLVNAIEHGNLGLTYADKSTLLRGAGWEAEVTRRLALPEYRDRRVRVGLLRRDDRIELTISDDGAGFDWNPYLEIQPERVFDLHGRGIAMSRMTSFDTVEYRGSGNEVVLTVLCGNVAAVADAGEAKPLSAAA